MPMEPRTVVQHRPSTEPAAREAMTDDHGVLKARLAALMAATGYEDEAGGWRAYTVEQRSLHGYGAQILWLAVCTKRHYGIAETRKMMAAAGLAGMRLLDMMLHGYPQPVGASGPPGLTPFGKLGGAAMTQRLAGLSGWDEPRIET